MYRLVHACVHLHCIALHCIALHCIALHCIAVHCIALHCFAQHEWSRMQTTHEQHVMCSSPLRIFLLCLSLSLLCCTLEHCGKPQASDAGLTNERTAAPAENVQIVPTLRQHLHRSRCIPTNSVT